MMYTKDETQMMTKLLQNCINKMIVMHTINSNNEQNRMSGVINTLQLICQEIQLTGNINISKAVIEKQYITTLPCCSNYVGTIPIEINNYEYLQTKSNERERERESSSTNQQHNIRPIYSNIQNENKEILLQQEIQQIYLERTIKGKKELWQHKWQSEEAKLQNELQELENNIKMEEKAHEEIVIFYKKQLEDLGVLKGNWIQKHKDIKIYEEKIKKLDNDHETICEEIKQLTCLYNSRQAEIDEYLLEKKKREEEEEYEKLRIQMAIRIQCWWRGTMVRWCLGSYKRLLKLKMAKKRKMSMKPKCNNRIIVKK